MEAKFCTVCSVPCTQSCSKCKNVSYCSKEHQTNHWKEHQKECHPFKIGTHPDKGRVLFATKDMAAYAIIIQEQSIINLPNGDEQDKLNGKICVSCCKVSENLKNCSKCSAPVCGRDCEMAEIHADYECQVLSGGSSYRNVTAYSKFVDIIRCLLLKSRDRKKYDVLMTLQSNKEHILADKNYAERFTENSTTVGLILTDYDLEEITTVIGIIDTNSLVTTTQDSSGNQRNSMHLYAKTCIASHSCVPNARPIILESGRVKLIATRPIKAEEEITIAYTGWNQGTVERQKKLSHCFYFSCKCTRCENPTEFGTNFSSVKCPMCPEGYFLPKCRWDSKQDLETEVLWMCNGCSKENTDPEVQEMLAPIEKEIVEFQSKVLEGMKTVQEFEELIAKYSGNILHPNHYLLCRIEKHFTETMRLMIILGQQDSSKLNLSMQDILYLKKTVVTKCRKLLTVWDKLFPGPEQIRGQMLYILWNEGVQNDSFNNTLAMFLSLQLQQKRVIRVPDVIKDYMEIAKEAVEILSLEPDGTIYQNWVGDLNAWIRIVQPNLSI